MSESVKQTFYDISKEVINVNPIETKDTSRGMFKWGKDNLYPQYLASLMYNCATHGGIIRSKVHYTVSGGLMYDGASKEAFLKFYNNGLSDYNLDELSETLSRDMELLNAYAFTITFVGGQVYQLDHVPFEKLRKALNGDWLYSENWTDRRVEVVRYVNLDVNKPFGKQIVVYMEKPMQMKVDKAVTLSQYPVPPYSGGIFAIETDIQINNYRKNEIANNFSLGTIVNFNNGKPDTEKDKEDILDTLQSTAQGSSNAGGVFATFNNGKDRETTVANLTGNNLDSRYLQLSVDNKENILLAHSVTSPMIFGIKTAGQLGGTAEVEMLYGLMKNGYFKYRQRAILTTLNYVANRLVGIVGKLSFNEVQIFQTVKNEGDEILSSLNAMSPLLANAVLKELTSNEVRALINLEPKEGGDVISNNVDDVAFSEQKVIETFSQFGKEKSNLQIFKSRSANPDNLDEEGFMKFQKFAELTDLKADILIRLQKGMSKEEIASDLKLTNSALSKLLTELTAAELLTDNKPTPQATSELINRGLLSIEVSYSYEVKSELGQPELLPTSREFCKEMIRLNRVYTRQEIEQISAITGTDVWRYRGGFYHNPQTNKTTTSCRHYWQQNIVIR